MAPRSGPQVARTGDPTGRLANGLSQEQVALSDGVLRGRSLSAQGPLDCIKEVKWLHSDVSVFASLIT
jgi:hypothetical protein